MKKHFKFSIFSTIILGLGLCINNGLHIANAGANEMTQPSISYQDESEYSIAYYEDIRGKKNDDLLEGLALLSQTKHRVFTSYGALRGAIPFSDEDPSDSTKVIDCYTGWSIDNTWDGGAYWNREHVWPQSLSDGLYGESGAGSDIHHIRPSVPGINSARGNNLFADINSTTTYKYNGRDTGCYLEGGLFEPSDSFKGDTARILMYLYMHYSNEVSANSNYSYASKGTLTITNVVSANSNQAAWNLLMKWNELDPVDTFESDRNDYCTSITGVRNPFIDHPEFAKIIWDSSYSGEGALSDSSSTPVEDYLRLSINSLNLEVNKTYQINPITNISSPSFSYDSSNKAVATISSTGLITALSSGTSIITVSCDNLSASLTLTVTEDKTPSLESGTVKYTIDSKTSVSEENAPLNTSATYNQTYSNKSQITSGNSATLTLSGYEGLTITGFTLSMHSNKSAGAGSLIVTSGSETIYSIEKSGFNTNNWYGSYINTYVDINCNQDNLVLREVQEGENVVFKITASSNSLYIQSYTITYSTNSSNIEKPEDSYLNLNEESLTLDKGETYQVNPITNIENPNYIFDSSNLDVATISSKGMITALSKGTSTITVSCEDLSASFVLTVTDSFGDLKSEIEDIETKAQLNFGYTYTQNEESIDYTYFGNANIRYSATIPNDLLKDVESYGINISIGDNSQDYELNNMVVGTSKSSFSAIINNIDDFMVDIKVTAFVYINDIKIELKSKTYSVYSMVEKYINEASLLGLSTQQVEVLSAFKLYMDEMEKIYE